MSTVVDIAADSASQSGQHAPGAAHTTRSSVVVTVAVLAVIIKIIVVIILILIDPGIPQVHGRS